MNEFAHDIQQIITSDEEIHSAWRTGGMAGAVRVLVRQRDEARAALPAKPACVNCGGPLPDPPNHCNNRYTGHVGDYCHEPPCAAAFWRAACDDGRTK